MSTKRIPAHLIEISRHFESRSALPEGDDIMIVFSARFEDVKDDLELLSTISDEFRPSSLVVIPWWSS